MDALIKIVNKYGSPYFDMTDIISHYDIDFVAYQISLDNKKLPEIPNLKEHEYIVTEDGILIHNSIIRDFDSWIKNDEIHKLINESIENNMLQK